MTPPDRPSTKRRPFNPDGNERLVSAAGLVLLALSVVELATLVLGLQHFLSLHVFIGLVLLPPIALKIAGTGWRFARYYSRNQAYRMKGAPELAMRMLAPLLVLMTIVLFGSGVAMGFTHGRALEIARRLHGPAAFLWTVLVAAHVLVYLGRAVRSTAADIVPATRRNAAGAKTRAYVLAVVIAGGLVLGAATLPVQRHWLHLPSRHHHDAAPAEGTLLVEKTKRVLRI